MHPKDALEANGYEYHILMDHEDVLSVGLRSLQPSSRKVDALPTLHWLVILIRSRLVFGTNYRRESGSTKRVSSEPKEVV